MNNNSTILFASCAELYNNTAFNLFYCYNYSDTNWETLPTNHSLFSGVCQANIVLKIYQRGISMFLNYP